MNAILSLSLSPLASSTSLGPSDRLGPVSVALAVTVGPAVARVEAPTEPRDVLGFAPHASAPGGDDDDGDPLQEHGEEVDLEDAPVSATPRRYKVIFHNDDYTTMEFVVDVLKRYFHKTDTEAVHIMLTVHKTGAAVAAVYTRDVAETKAAEVMEYARENGMPLLVTTEPE